jgi:hypothetical protein
MQIVSTAQDRPTPKAPDLQTQLEDLLHAVWAAEAMWRLEDRIERVLDDPRARISTKNKLKGGLK